MVKILIIVARNIEAGGVEAYLLNVLKQINKDNLKFEVLVPGKIISEKTADKFRELGCKLCVLNITQNEIVGDLQLIRGVCNILSSEEYNIVHVNTANLRVEAICLFLAKQKNIYKRIAHSHGTLIRGSIIKELSRNILRKFIFHNANEFLACSHAAADSLVGEKHSCKVKIAKNGIDTELYKFNHNIREKIRTENRWSDRFVIGIIARISPEKNHLFLLRVMKELSYRDSRSLLVIVGRGDDKYEKLLMDEVERLDIKPYVNFMGEQNNINELLQGLDLHVLPSIREALGIVNIEAQAAGLHCICSDRVPVEVNVTGLIEFLSLESGEEFWAERIQAYDNNYKRENTTEILKENGYDISSSAQIISHIYNSSIDGGDM